MERETQAVSSNRGLGNDAIASSDATPVCESKDEISVGSIVSRIFSTNFVKQFFSRVDRLNASVNQWWVFTIQKGIFNCVVSEIV